MSALHHATARKVQAVEDDGTLCHPTVRAPGKRGKVRYLHQLALAVALDDGVDRVRRADVVTRLGVPGRLLKRQPIEPHEISSDSSSDSSMCICKPIAFASSAMVRITSWYSRPSNSPTWWSNSIGATGLP